VKVFLRGSKTILRPILPHVPRSLAEVAPVLRKALKNLLAGQAAWPLYVFGLAGRGKTCAALCAIDAVTIQQGFDGWDGVLPIQAGHLWTVEDLVQAHLHNDSDVWDRLRSVDLAVIDELGVRSAATDLEYVSVKRAADIREFRPAIWISNHPPAKIRQIYDERIYSRICCGVVVELKGKDRRFVEKS
jgi:DNA replication protein DnaC